MRVSRLLALLFSLLPFLLAGAGQAAEDEDEKYLVDVREKLAQQFKVYGDQSYKRSQKDLVELLARGKPKVFPLQLHAAVTYAIVAACDNDCAHVALVLRDGDGRQLAQTPDRHHTVVINGMPNQSGRHSVAVSVPGCKEDECYVGLMLLQQGAISPTGQAKAPSVASAIMTAPKDLPFRTYDNHDLVGGDLRHMKDTDVETCASTCGADRACIAYSFDKWNRWCFLKGVAKSFRLEPNTLTALRSDIPVPELISTPVTMLQYRNKAFPYSGQSTRTAESYEECASRCAGESACVALTYFRTNKQCRLMETTGEYFPDSRADSAVKRQEPTR